MNITRAALRDLGFHFRVLNGIIDEFSYPLFGRDDAPLTNCLLVRFNEHPDHPVVVYLVTGNIFYRSVMTRLTHVTTIEQVVKVIEALKG